MGRRTGARRGADGALFTGGDRDRGEEEQIEQEEEVLLDEREEPVALVGRRTRWAGRAQGARDDDPSRRREVELLGGDEIRRRARGARAHLVRPQGVVHERREPGLVREGLRHLGTVRAPAPRPVPRRV